jgi:hypothetical protein
VKRRGRSWSLDVESSPSTWLTGPVVRVLANAHLDTMEG